jgi:hypothetical protein
MPVFPMCLHIFHLLSSHLRGAPKHTQSTKKHIEPMAREGRRSTRVPNLQLCASQLFREILPTL